MSLMRGHIRKAMLDALNNGKQDASNSPRKNREAMMPLKLNERILVVRLDALCYGSGKHTLLTLPFHMWQFPSRPR